MKTLDELDRLHAAATAGEWSIDSIGALVAKEPASLACDVYGKGPNMVAIVALHNAWPSVSARLRAAEALVAKADAVCAAALELLKVQQAEVERLRGALSRARAALGEP